MDFLKDIIEKHPIRKTEEQKESFRNYVLNVVASKGVSAKVETLGNNKNVVIGDPLTAKSVFTAHYDTPNASLCPNLMLPKNKGLFIAYQFLIVAILLVISLVPAIVVGVGVLKSEIAYGAIFLVLYFGLFLLNFKAFTNKNNSNDNTSGVATVLSIIEKLDGEQLKDVAFILFDNEEKGLLGSKAYKKAYKEQLKDKLFVNFDCVANGNNVLLIAKQNAEKSENFSLLKGAFLSKGQFSVEFCSAKNCVANTDYKNFEQGVCVLACKKSKRGILYTPFIHTKKDVVADSQNVEFLANGSCEFINNLNKTDEKK